MKDDARYCEAELEEMSPDQLIQASQDPTADNVDLTFIAEWIGKKCPEEMAVPVLEKILRHKDSLVKEGAVIGMLHFPSRKNLKILRRALSSVEREKNPHPCSIQEILKEAIEDMSEEIYHG